MVPRLRSRPVQDCATTTSRRGSAVTEIVIRHIVEHRIEFGAGTAKVLEDLRAVLTLPVAPAGTPAGPVAGTPEQDPERSVGRASDEAIMGPRPAPGSGGPDGWPPEERASPGQTSGDPGYTWTPERDAELRRLYVTHTSIGEIWAVLNRMRGARITNKQSVYNRAAYLQLKRPAIQDPGSAPQPDPGPASPPAFPARAAAVRANFDTAIAWAAANDLDLKACSTRAQVVRWINAERIARDLGTFIIFDLGDSNAAWPTPVAPKPAPAPVSRAEAMAAVAASSAHEFLPADWPEIRAWAEKHAPLVAGQKVEAINLARRAKGLKPYRVEVRAPMTERAAAGA